LAGDKYNYDVDLRGFLPGIANSPSILLLSVITIPLVIQQGLPVTRESIIEEEFLETTLIATTLFVTSGPSTISPRPSTGCLRQVHEN
jgi:hypothetical protein